MLSIEQIRAQFGQDMTSEQQAHIEGIIEEFSVRVYKKYADGQREHGGNLWMKPIVLSELINETLDFVVYGLTLKKQIEDSGVQLGDPTLTDG